MADFQEHKIEIFPGINDEAVAPTENSGQNISYSNAKYNNLIDELQFEINGLRNEFGNTTELTNNTINFINSDIEKLKLLIDKVDFLTTRIEALEQASSNPYKFTVDLTTTETELITLDEAIVLSEILVEGYTDVYGFTFKLNENSLGGGVPEETDGIAKIAFDPVKNLNIGDTITVYSFSEDMPNVTITLVTA